MSTTKEPYTEATPPVNTALALTGPGARHFRLHATGVEVLGRPTIEQYQEAFEILSRAKEGIQWGIADLLLSAEKHHGETYAQLVDPLGIDYAPHTLHNFTSVAGRFDPARRRPGLSFGHHAAVAYEDPAVADEFLSQAAVNRWSVTRLKEALGNYRRALKEGSKEDSNSRGETPDVGSSEPSEERLFVDRLLDEIATGDVSEPFRLEFQQMVQAAVDRIAPGVVSLGPAGLKILRKPTLQECVDITLFLEGARSDAVETAVAEARDAFGDKAATELLGHLARR